MAMELKTYLKRRQSLVNRALEKVLPASGADPALIHRAMRYSVLGEGKRIRPILALAACEAVGGRASAALHAACALELIHAYSLVHDDLPAMDDDDFRRGKPSCHKKFGEALGILTGDALLTHAFELLTRANSAEANGAASSTFSSRDVPRSGASSSRSQCAEAPGAASSSRSHHDPSVHLAVIREVSKAIGTQGMIGGQVADVTLGESRPTSRRLEAINVRKTGALIAASVRVGALLGGASSPAYRALCRYGRRIGLAFQLVDDLLDGDGSARVSSRDEVRRRAEALTQSALRDLNPLGRRAEPLRALARFILTRGS